MIEMKYFAIKGHVKNNFEAIALCADKLYHEGCVNKDFKQNCIQREKNFPTGLPSVIPAAMPHTESSDVLEDAICILILDTPVAFNRMDDDEQTIMAKMIFNLALTNSNKHMLVLQNLMKVFYTKEEMDALLYGDLSLISDRMRIYLKDE